MMRKVYRAIFHRLINKMRRWHYKMLSESLINGHKPDLFQPLYTTGKGSIRFGERVRIGVYSSPFYFNGYCYIECRYKKAEVFIDDDTWCNNNFSIICERTSVYIGKQVRIGLNVCIMDSDFHDVDPSLRNSGDHVAVPVRIGDNVFIGNNVSILKGVEIGSNCVIASGSVVNSSIPENCIAGGVPARVLKQLGK